MIATAPNPEGICRDCDALIYWLASPANRNTPINREPVADGNIVIDLAAGTWRLRRKDEQVEPRYESHFRTCPAANARRRR